jgi:hypothetical protein
VLILQCYLCHKGTKHNDYNKKIGDIIQNNLSICDIMGTRLQILENLNKLTEQV